MTFVSTFSQATSILSMVISLTQEKFMAPETKVIGMDGTHTKRVSHMIGIKVALGQAHSYDLKAGLQARLFGKWPYPQGSNENDSCNFFYH